jgi:hypothetical protein
MLRIVFTRFALAQVSERGFRFRALPENEKHPLFCEQSTYIV